MCLIGSSDCIIIDIITLKYVLQLLPVKEPDGWPSHHGGKLGFGHLLRRRGLNSGSRAATTTTSHVHDCKAQQKTNQNHNESIAALAATAATAASGASGGLPRRRIRHLKERGVKGAQLRNIFKVEQTFSIK